MPGVASETADTKPARGGRAEEKGDKPKPAGPNSRNFPNYCECSMSVCSIRTSYVQCTGAQSLNSSHNQHCSNKRNTEICKQIYQYELYLGLSVQLHTFFD